MENNAKNVENTTEIQKIKIFHNCHSFTLQFIINIILIFIFLYTFKSPKIRRASELTSMALSSMVFGYWARPPYWKVLFRFCSLALAMPCWWWAADSRIIIIRVDHEAIMNAAEGFYLDMPSLGSHWHPAETSAETASWPRSSDGKLWGCTSASILFGSCLCMKTQTRLKRFPIAIAGEPAAVGVSRFGAGVGGDLFHHLAVGFILHQTVIST